MAAYIREHKDNRCIQSIMTYQPGISALHEMDDTTLSFVCTFLRPPKTSFVWQTLLLLSTRHNQSSRIMKNTLSLSIGIMLMCVTAWAQNEKTRPTVTFTRVTFERNIVLDNDSKPEDVIVTIEPGTKEIDLVISSTIEAGEVIIELSDPGGIRAGNFTVGTQLDTKKQERVAGKLQKSLDEPQPGNWKIRIAPTAAKGSVKIQTLHKQ